jgi:hypothetical protein
VSAVPLFQTDAWYHDADVLPRLPLPIAIAVGEALDRGYQARMQERVHLDGLEVSQWLDVAAGGRTRMRVMGPMRRELRAAGLYWCHFDRYFKWAGRADRARLLAIGGA